MTWQGDYPPQIRRWRYTARQVLDGEFDTAAAEVLHRLRASLEVLGEDGCWLCKAAAQNIAELQGRKHE